MLTVKAARSRQHYIDIKEREKVLGHFLDKKKKDRRLTISYSVSELAERTPVMWFLNGPKSETSGGRALIDGVNGGVWSVL